MLPTPPARPPSSGHSSPVDTSELSPQAAAATVFLNENLGPAQLQALFALTLAPAGTFSEQLREYLVTACRLLGMTTGILGHAEANRYEIMAAVNPPPGKVEGAIAPLNETYCNEVVEQAGCIAYANIASTPALEAHPALKSMPFQSYIAAPVWTEGRLTGTVCFGDNSPRAADFSASDRALVETLASLLGGLIDRENARKRLTSELGNLRLAYQEMELLFSRCQLPMAIMDFHGHWTRLNPALAQLLGTERSELQRGALEDVSHPADMQACQEALLAMQAGEITHFEQPHRYLGRQGQIIEVMLHLDVIDSHSGVILSQHQDLSERRSHEESLARMRHKLASMAPPGPAVPSVLDKLLPAEIFEQQLDGEIARSARHGQPLSILLLNVDAFTDFNRQYGRAAGDRALQQVSTILRNATRKSDLLSQRDDGSLIAVLGQTDSSGAIILAERVRHATAELHGLDGPVTCSIGLTCYHPAPDTLTLANRLELCERAQHALKKAKRQGRNRVRFLELEPVIPTDTFASPQSPSGFPSPDLP
ncbi:diguanylate cyclase domain-containing protein [Cobetia amphilecti]|uniref:diguanylate cyclase domain-containing protein n=2 Tax=Cobetia TaxID=204286 RepID=UPI0026E15616|nr:diguanylate cyclase [Cobetia amphilecti]MDO6816350.1 diguanylate cyclase [Cobetia amphilecti]